MKTPALIALGVLTTLHALASCTANDLRVFPNGQRVTRNVIFMLEGYGASQPIINKLNVAYPVYLLSGSKRTKLLVREQYVGQFNIAQAILVPETPLEPGLTYRFQIDKLPADQHVKRWSKTAKDWVAIEFTATDSVDTQAPVLTGIPEMIGKTIVQYGCGPEIFVRFGYPVQGEEEVLVKTTVRNRQTGTITTYYLEPLRGEVNVGHNMCSGAFRFGAGTAYDVTFTCMDASGNKTQSSESIGFTKPTESAVLDEPVVMPD